MGLTLTFIFRDKSTDLNIQRLHETKFQNLTVRTKRIKLNIGRLLPDNLFLCVLNIDDEFFF